MNIIWAVGSRTGSEFVIQLSLTSGLIADRQLKLNTFRGYELRGIDLPKHGRMDYAAVSSFCSKHDVQGLKIEDPGIDDICLQTIAEYPNVPIVSCFRPFAKVARSHASIRPWGMPPERAWVVYCRNLEIYRELNRDRRLFMVDVEHKEAFDVSAFCQHIGVESSSALAKFVEGWPVVNDLEGQKKLSRDTTPKLDISDVTLPVSENEIAAVEAAYRELAASNRV